MLHTYHISFKEYYYGYLSTASGYYTYWSHNYSLQIGFPDTTMKQTDEEIPGTHITINAIESCTDIPDCKTAEEIRKVILEDEHLNALAELILCSCVM